MAHLSEQLALKLALTPVPGANPAQIPTRHR